MSVGGNLTSRGSEQDGPVAAGVTVTPNTPVAKNTSAQWFLPLAATGASQEPVHGFPETSGAGTKVEGTGIFTHVLVNTQGRRVDAEWSWTVGRPIYLSRSVAGGLTQAAPNQTNDMVQMVAMAETENSLMINIGMPTWVL